MFLRKLISKPTFSPTYRGGIAPSLYPTWGVGVLSPNIQNEEIEPYDVWDRRQKRHKPLTYYNTGGSFGCGSSNPAKPTKESTQPKPGFSRTSCRPPEDYKGPGPESPASFGLLVPVSESLPLPLPQGSLVLAY